MAQVDTGLGWSAKDTWLIQSGNIEIAQDSIFGGADFPNMPVAKNIQTWADLMAQGTPVYYWKSPYEDNIFKVACMDDVDCLIFLTDNYTMRAISAVPGNHRMCYGGTKGAWYPYNGGSWSYDQSTGLYYSYPFNSVSPDYYGYYSSNITYFSTVRAALDAVSVNSMTFTKTNPGYAVSCVAKWKTPNNTILESPILISTESENVEMSTSATGIYFAKLNMMYQGRKFYMGFYDRPYNGNLTTSFPVVDRSYSEAPTFTLEELFRYIAGEVYSNIVVLNVPDPYQEEDGSSTEGGGDGQDDEADNVDFTDPPSTSIGATGLLTIFCPDLYQLQSLGNYMWSTFDVDNWRKIIANPMDAILGLHTLPVPAVITGTKAVKVAGIDTTIDMSYTTVRYIRRPMGSCEIPKKWGAYLDYSPYTKISIFLPFIGFKELDVDDVMGQTISLQYMVDILTGACVVELKCGDTVLYTWSGNCANEVPISGSDWRGAIASAIGIAATVAGTALVTGGATAPMAASMVASVGANSMNLKPTINRSGAISGSSGFMSQKRPYIIRSIPNLVIPADQNKFIGYPSFVTTSLGSLTGYNEIASIHLEGIPATGNELSEIETLLKGGVIF